MSRLRSTFGEQVDFIHIDWEDDGSEAVIRHFGVLRRSTYIILSPEGEILWQFIGPLDFDLVAAEFERVLNGSN